MGAESESGSKGRITASQEKAWLWKDILDRMDFSQIIFSCYVPNIILLCHCNISSFKDRKIMTIGSYINIIPIPYICQFGLLFFKNVS